MNAETKAEPLIYSNARTYARFEDWPYGNVDKCVCQFYVERHPKRGERMCRRTSNRNGGWNKPKMTTYTNRIAIVDGSDGKTYILGKSSQVSFLHVMQANMQYEQETIWPKDGERYEQIAYLLEHRVETDMDGENCYGNGDVTKTNCKR